MARPRRNLPHRDTTHSSAFKRWIIAQRFGYPAVRDLLAAAGYAVSTEYVRTIAAGTALPSEQAIRAIEEISGGRVKRSHFIAEDDARIAQAQARQTAATPQE